MGDPAGIGPEVTAKAIKRLRQKPGIKFLIIGDNFILSRFIHRLPENCKILDLNNVPRKNFCFGKLSPAYGKASWEYINKAVSLLKGKKIDLLVTAPVSKEAISSSGLKFFGHTEFLAESFKVSKFAMMFVSDKIKTTLVTRHIPLKNVAVSLTRDNIYQAICLTSDSLKGYFGISNPKIAVCGLNPHAGENGLLGREEDLIIRPAIKRALVKCKNISGPYPSDTIFHSALKGKFDGIVAMYHDQGMIPLKTLFFRKIVNLTLGLPFIRTSPAHGTAFDIAGNSVADAGSMTEAIKLAVSLALKNKCRN